MFLKIYCIIAFDDKNEGNDFCTPLILKTFLIMSKGKIISIVLLCLLIAGCASNKIDELKPKVNDKNAITIELFNNKTSYRLEPIKMSEFVDSIKFIILEETKESLIKYPNKIFFTPEQIMVVDRDLGTIFFFDRNGKYLSKISKRGQGPGEYVSLSYCMFDEQKQQLIVYDNHVNKMLFYDFSGNLIREIFKFCEGTILRDIINLDNGNFLCYEFDGIGNERIDEKYIGLWEVDADGKFIRSYFTYNVKLPTTFGSTYLQRLHDGTISITDNYHQDIYHYKNEALEKYISYNIKGNKLPRYIGKTSRDGDMADMINVRAYSHQEKGDYIITLWLDHKFPRPQAFFSLFSKKDKKVLRYWDAFNSYDPAVPAVMSWMIDSNSSDILVCNLSINYIDEHLDNQNLPELVRDSLMSLSAKLGDSENPVLELLYIKK